MLRKCIMLLILSLTFVTAVSFAQNGGAMADDKNEEAIQMEYAVNKLSVGMATDEVLQLLGEPKHVSNVGKSSIYIYEYVNLKYLILLSNNDKLSAALNKDGVDLLSTEYIAKTIHSPVLVDNNEILTSNPILTINDQTYLPIEDLEEEFSIKVSRYEEKRQLEMKTIIITFMHDMSIIKSINIETNTEDDNILSKNKKGITQLKETINKLEIDMTWEKIVELIGNPTRDAGSGLYIPQYLFEDGESLTFGIYGDIAAYNKDGFDLLATEYLAKTVYFPVLIDDKEQLTSNPIVSINNKIYVPIENLAQQLGIKVCFNEEKQQLEIVTKKEN